MFVEKLYYYNNDIFTADLSLNPAKCTCLKSCTMLAHIPKINIDLAFKLSLFQDGDCLYDVITKIRISYFLIKGGRYFFAMKPKSIKFGQQSLYIFTS